MAVNNVIRKGRWPPVFFIDRKKGVVEIVKANGEIGNC
jgi:hypothetical protein